MTILTRDEIIVCLQKLNIPGITIYQLEGIQQACEMILASKIMEEIEFADCTLCAKEDCPGFYTGCMVNDGHGKTWSCKNGKLIRWRILL